MKDSVTIKSNDGGAYFEITRELSEVVNRANLMDRLDSLNQQEENLVEQLDMVRKNKQIVQEALDTNEGGGTI